jgi:hypothetical protein
MGLKSEEKQKARKLHFRKRTPSAAKDDRGGRI